MVSGSTLTGNTCSDGFNGTGTCQCGPLYRGLFCQVRCPTATGYSAPCSGHGACNYTGTGPASCTCEPNWAGAHCDECSALSYGSDCASAVPSADGVPCAGHGHVSAGRQGQGCVCGAGWYGAACDLPCPGSAYRICNGHGYCNNDTTNWKHIL